MVVLDRELTLRAAQRQRAPPLGAKGVISFARAFLGAGAMNVFATLWDVVDAAAPVFVADLHRRLRGDYRLRPLMPVRSKSKRAR